MNSLLIIMFFTLLTNTVSADELEQVIFQKQADKIFSALKADAAGFAVVTQQIAASNKAHAEGVRDPKNPPAAIKSKDDEWKTWAKTNKHFDSASSTGPEFILAIMKNPCSDTLRGLMKANKHLSEVFVMDKMGVNVCAAQPTSDYDQGDEEKWFNVFKEGKSHDFGAIKMDESSGKKQMQVSQAIMEGSEKIGVITMGLTLDTK